MTIRPLTILAISLLVTGCPEDPTAVPGDTTAAEPTELDCNLREIPCALSDVPIAVLERSDELGDDVTDLLTNGMTLMEAWDWIEAQQDVVDAQADDNALRFRVDGGRDVWVLTQAALAPAIGDLPAPPLVGSGQSVVGQDPSEKSALVLGPFKHEFGEHDDGTVVSNILTATRGYSNSVILLENETPTSTTVGISNFKAWEDFDVIHVSSHGATICDVNDHCSTVVYTGDTYGSAQELLTLTELGISTARIVGDDRNFFSIGADFFAANYPSGLTDSLVYISACETLGIGDNDVAAALLGEDSAYMGWSQASQSNAARAAAAAFYTHASEQGSTATEAWSELGPLRINAYTDKEGVDYEAELLVATDDDRDVRIREVITLLHPVDGTPLTDGTAIPVVGTAGDGVADSFAYRIQIDGVPEGEADTFVVHLAVDGIDAPPMTAAEGQAIGESSWIVSGELPLGQDAANEQSLELESWVELPEGGTSEHAATPILREMVEAWEGRSSTVFVGVLTDTTIRATATVRFELVRESRGIKTFEIVSGNMEWSISGTVYPPSGECHYGFGPIDVPIIHATGNRLSIDTNTVPATYTGFGNTIGDEIRVATGCGEGAYSTRPRTVWFSTLDAENLNVSPDGNRISGSNSSNTSQWNWTFDRR